MPRIVLVPLDGSPLGERALPYAEMLAGKGDGGLVLVRAVPYLSRPANDEPYPTLAAARAAATREARDYLEGVAARLAARGIVAEIAVLEEDEALGIVGEAGRRGAGLIAMTTHGRSGLGRWLYGSVAEEVLARAPIPTLLVRAWLPGGGAATLGERPRLLVPLDGSPQAEEALPVAEALADELAAELVLLRAVARPDLPLAPDALLAPLLREELAAEQAEAETYVRGLAERYAREGRAVQAVVRVWQPGLDMAASVIDAVGRERGAALVIMTSGRRTGLERVVFGSVADATIRHGTLPVVLVRPHGDSDTTGTG